MNWISPNSRAVVIVATISRLSAPAASRAGLSLSMGAQTRYTAYSACHAISVLPQSCIQSPVRSSIGGQVSAAASMKNS